MRLASCTLFACAFAVLTLATTVSSADATEGPIQSYAWSVNVPPGKLITRVTFPTIPCQGGTFLLTGLSASLSAGTTHVMGPWWVIANVTQFLPNNAAYQIPISALAGNTGTATVSIPGGQKFRNDIIIQLATAQSVLLMYDVVLTGHCGVAPVLGTKPVNSQN